MDTSVIGPVPAAPNLAAIDDFAVVGNTPLGQRSEVLYTAVDRPMRHPELPRMRAAERATLTAFAGVFALIVTWAGAALLTAQECTGCIERRPTATAGSCADEPGSAQSRHAGTGVVPGISGRDRPRPAACQAA